MTIRFANLACAVAAGLCAGAYLPTPAFAACFQAVGCTHDGYLTDGNLYRTSCLNLRYLRNSIYAENGYCFRSPEYLNIFGNDNCRFEKSEDVPLTLIERSNILSIVHAEQAKGCRN
jgi:hypothetical protein